MTIHFLADNAAQLASMFDRLYAKSPTFRRDTAETANTFIDKSKEGLRRALLYSDSHCPSLVTIIKSYRRVKCS